MQYVSTRGQVEPATFQDAVIMGLAEDGGLMVPQGIPDVRDRLEDWTQLSYNELALEIFRLFTDDLDSTTLESLIAASYGRNFAPEVAPVVHVGPLHILELFHGPTLAFKDVALQFLGNLFEHILSLRDQRLNILAATSGDTGSAAIYGVRGRDRIEIFVMHPAGGVSPIQERQMTSVLDKNVHNMAVEGSFDDCQGIMKSLASDLDFKRKYHLGAVNSVNWARVLAQIVYYFHGVLRLMRSTGASAVRVAVPTGNFGDILAGWYARQMGLPISKLILATNENDILARFFNTGTYSLGEVFKSLSPAMDIQVASNFERYLYYRLGENPHQLRELIETFSRTGHLEVSLGDGEIDVDFAAGRADSEDTLRTIAEFYNEYGYVMDPHAAVGVCVALRQESQGDPILALATAHPAKFPDAIRRATGADVAHHPDIDRLSDLPTRCDRVVADDQAVRDYLVRVLDARWQER